MAVAEIKETLNVDKDQLFAAICRYEDYPKFVDGVKSVKVERKGPGVTKAMYHVNMLKDVTYSLDIKDNAESGVIEWSLIESDFFKINNGRWELKSVGPGKTEAHYRLEIEFKFPVPGMILNKLIKNQLPAMIKSFEKQAKAHGG